MEYQEEVDAELAALENFSVADLIRWIRSMKVAERFLLPSAIICGDASGEVVDNATDAHLFYFDAREERRSRLSAHLASFKKTGRATAAASAPSSERGAQAYFRAGRGRSG